MKKIGFTATIEGLRRQFDIDWGDTTRIRDLYTPYFDLEVRLSEHSRENLPVLMKILLYSFEQYAANIRDEFDETDYWRGSKFSQLETGSKLSIVGFVHRKLASHNNLRFENYRYFILNPDLHGRKWDVNGDLQMGITEWLVEENPIGDVDELTNVTRLVVAWECAELG